MVTYIAFLVVLTIGAKAIGFKIGKFIYGFTVIFWLTILCVILGNYANIAANAPGDIKRFGLTWSLRLTGEAGLIIALLAGLFISNFLPKFADSLKEAARPEWYIKTAIVILGAGIGVKAVGAMGLATAVMFRGLCAIIEAYLIYWALVYWMARKWFGFSREWSAPLASGISICGVSAAIATGGAIRARPIVPIMVSSLVVIFAVVELIFLPFLAQTFLYTEPHGCRGMDGAGGENGWRGGRQRGDRGFPDPGQSPRGSGDQVRAGVDACHRHDGQDLHRHLYRCLGVHPGCDLDHRY